MNIFILDKDLHKSAQLLCDQHLNKQILELAQIICTVKHIEGMDTPYKPTHINHPVIKWALESEDNFQFCLMYNWLYLGKEYKYRFNKSHKAATMLIQFYDGNAPAVTITEFPIRNDIDLIKEKLEHWLTRTDKRQIITRWTNRETPEWYSKLLIKHNKVE